MELSLDIVFSQKPVFGSFFLGKINAMKMLTNPVKSIG